MSERIRITSDLLPDAGSSTTGTTASVPPPPRARRVSKFLRGTWFVYCFAGLASGLGSTALAEMLFRATDTIRSLDATGIVTPFDMIIVSIAIGVIGGCIAASIAAAELVAAGAYQRALSHAAISFGAGAIGAIAGLAFAGMGLSALEAALADILPGDPEPNLLLLVAKRGILWMFLGTAVGLAAALPSRSRRFLIICGVGGAIGGLASGLIFDPITMLGGTATASRMIGFTLFASFITTAIVLTSETTKSAWIQVTDGFLSGKQFLLSRESTAIGALHASDIFLPKDRSVQPQHATIRRTGRSLLLTPQGGTWINNQRVTSPQILRDLDQIRIGSSLLTLRIRH